MISSAKSAITTAALMVALLVMTTRTAEGQSDCAARLISCAEYLNSTNPAPACCNAIRDVVSNQLQLNCLCNLYNNPSLVGINMTQALELPKHCNLSADTSVCKALSPNSSPAPPSGVPGGDNGNGGKSVLSMGVSSLFLLFTVVVMFQ